MEIHERRLRSRALQRLGEIPPASAKRIRSFRTFLATESERLVGRHRFGLGGREIARGRSDLVDLVVMRVCRAVADDLGPAAADELRGCAVLALGGYGRRELSPQSDVDLLLLHPPRRTEAMKEFVERALPLLWDVGLEVGHSVRTVAECVEYGRTDLHARNAMSEARRVTGNADLVARFSSEMSARVFGHPRANRFFQRAMAAEVAGRRARFGSVVGMQEPHLKEGAGGLRDLHLVGWVGLARWGFRTLDELVRAGIVTQAEHGRALRAYDFLLRVRNDAHFLTGRRTDLLAQDLQAIVAERLGYSDQRTASASEIFMRDVYLRARDIKRFSERFLVAAEFREEPEPRLGILRRPRKLAVGPARRYRLEEGVIEAAPDTRLTDGEPDAERLFEVFDVAQQHGARVGDRLMHDVLARLADVDRRVRQDPRVATRFLRILGRTGRVAPTLRSMHETGLLSRYLPEFRRITLMVQHDHYHRYTIDEHTIKALEALDALAQPEARRPELGPLGSALDRVRDPARLALGLLLHDIGKGQGGEHVSKGTAIARRVCRRIGLGSDATEDVVFLVEKHLVMSRVSQRRDLSDDQVILGFADTVGSVERLRMLYVLTYADISAVGPGVWNEWKAALLNELYERTRQALERPAAARHPSGVEGRPSDAVLDKVLKVLHPEYLRSDVLEFLGHLPDRYTRLVPPDLIARHFEMVRRAPGSGVVTDWRPSSSGPYTVVSVCVPDARGVLGRIAGALTGAGLDILSVDVFTRDDGLVLDVFRVSEAMGPGLVDPVPEERQAAVTEEIQAVLSGARDPAAAVDRERVRQRRRRRGPTPHPPVVRFDGPDAAGRTVIEVRADDEPGTVYRIATTLSELGLDIALAKIATEKNQALDVFYVRAGGGALPDARHDEVRRALLEALRSS